MINVLVNNYLVKFEGCLFHQAIGVPMGMNCAPLLADLFLFSYENECLDSLVRSGHKKFARSYYIFTELSLSSPLKQDMRSVKEISLFSKKSDRM